MNTAEYLQVTDYRLCLSFNRLSYKPLIKNLFVTVSRLGDGFIWYAVIFTLPLIDLKLGPKASLLLAISALSGVAIYHAIKQHFKRPRPFQHYRDIRAAAIALDECSFPSGHTLHAAAFTTILFQTFPQAGWAFLPFAILTALSRVILGLHYVSDVIAGATIGILLGNLILALSAQVL